MSAIIKGITVQLYVKEQIGVDAIGNAIFEETPVNVENVLVSPSEASGGTENYDSLNLTARKSYYTLALPKEDTHNWETAKVGFFGRFWRVIGEPVKGIESLIPLDWNIKVRVESLDD